MQILKIKNHKNQNFEEKITLLNQITKKKPRKKKTESSISSDHQPIKQNKHENKPK